MDKLIQMGKELGYEVQAWQEFVKQQQDIERSERLAEKELEKNKIAQVEKDREVELARIAADKDKIAQAEKIGKLSQLKLRQIGKSKSQCIFDFEIRNKQMFTEARAFSRVTYFFYFLASQLDFFLNYIARFHIPPLSLKRCKEITQISGHFSFIRLQSDA